MNTEELIIYNMRKTAVGVSWISRTPTEDALVIVLPTTAEHIGYENTKNTGQLKIITPKETVIISKSTVFGDCIE